MALDSPLESAVVKSLLKWLQKQPRTKAQKTHGSGLRMGTPDIIGSWQGRMLAVEVKRPGGDAPTKLQTRELDAWTDAGAITGVAHTLDELKEIIETEGQTWVIGMNIRKPKPS